MIPQWHFWVQNLALLAFAIFMVSKCVSHLRFNIGKRWVWSALFAVLYLSCMAASLSLVSLSNQQTTFVEKMKNPPEHSQIESNWGANFSVKERTKYSSAIAKSQFIDGGRFRSYIDLNGNLVEYKPSSDDRQQRLNLLQLIEKMETTSKVFFFVAIGWLLTPLLGIGIGFTSWLKSTPHPNQAFKRDS